jgi:hypothetical protein
MHHMQPRHQFLQEQRSKALGRLKAPIKQPQGVDNKNAPSSLTPRHSTCNKLTSTSCTDVSQKDSLEDGNSEQPAESSTAAAQVQQGLLEQRQLAVAKRTRFESNRVNLGNFERAYPVEVETVNVTVSPGKVWRLHRTNAHFIAGLWLAAPFCRW